MTLGATWVEANDLCEQIGRFIDVPIEYQRVGQIHHIACFPGRLFIDLRKKRLGGGVLPKLIQHSTGEIQYGGVGRLNAPHFFER